MTAGTHSTPNSRGLFWLILFLLTLLVVLIIWLTVGFRLNPDASNPNLTQIEPIAGGVVIPPPTAVPPSALADIVIDESMLSSLGDLVFVPQQPVLVTNQTTSGSADRMPIYAAPQIDADVRDAYPSGTVLTVLEPSGDYGNYPVEIEGISWVRVRDSSGLVGWTQVGMLYPVEAVEANDAVPLILRPAVEVTTPDEQPAQAPVEAIGEEAIEEVPLENTTEPQAEPTPTSTPAG